MIVPGPLGRGQINTTENYTSNGQLIVEGPIENPTFSRLLLHCGSFFANRNGEAFTGIFTIALTFATFLLGVLAWDQGQTTRAQLRAYLWGRAIELNDFEVGKVPYAKIVITNSGATAAKNVKTSGNVFFETIPFKSDHKIPSLFSGASRSVIPPNDTSFECPVYCESALTQPEFDELTSGVGRRAVIYVSFDYDDVFGRGRKTWVCVYTKPLRSPGEIRFIAANLHNDFT